MSYLSFKSEFFKFVKIFIVLTKLKLRKYVFLKLVGIWNVIQSFIVGGGGLKPLDSQESDTESIIGVEEPNERRPAADYLNEHLYSYDVNENNSQEETIIEETIVEDGKKIFTFSDYKKLKILLIILSPTRNSAIEYFWIIMFLSGFCG